MQKTNLKTILFSILGGSLSAILFIMIILFATGILPKENQTSVVETQQTKNVIENKKYISQQDLIVSAVENASPAVVSIIITKDVPILEEYYEDYNSPFDDFFGGSSFNFSIPKYRDSGETEEQKVGGGSGFFVSDDGYIVTNKHVVDEDDAEYTVFTNDGTEYKAEVIDKDSLNDIAILKIDGKNLPFLQLGDSQILKPGQSVIAIGNPLLEFNNSVSVGVISGLSRNITAGTRFYGKTEYLEDVIQTDAAINPGNSGGPLLNLDGKVIGVNVAIANGENLGFSIPSNIVNSIFDSVRKHGKIIRPFLGVRYVQITEELKEKNNLTVDYGVLVSRGETIEDLAVIPGSPSDKAGLKENDIILEIDGEKLDGQKSLLKIISSKNIGDIITLKVLEKGEEKEIKVTLEESEV